MEQQAKYAVEHARIRAGAEPASRPAPGATRADNRPGTAGLRTLAEAMDNSPRVVVQRKLAEVLDNSPRVAAQRKLTEAMNSGRRIAREQGPPQNLFAPTALQPVQLSALADAQGTDIHVAPVQEQHLPHEARHAVRQAQGKRPLAQNHQPIQRVKKRKKQRPSLKERHDQSQRDKKAHISRIQGADDIAWAKSVAATQSLIPDGYQPVKMGRDLGEGMEANTSFWKQNINVTYDRQLASSKRNERIGQLASTFTHELAVHGKNPPQRDKESPEPEEEHNAMHDPATRDEYLKVSLATHDSLENVKQKKAYARSWLKDMNFQIDGDESLDEEEKQARREWAQSQKDLMNERAEL